MKKYLLGPDTKNSYIVTKQVTINIQFFPCICPAW